MLLNIFSIYLYEFCVRIAHSRMQRTLLSLLAERTSSFHSSLGLVNLLHTQFTIHFFLLLLLLLFRYWPLRSLWVNRFHGMAR